MTIPERSARSGPPRYTRVAYPIRASTSDTSGVRTPMAGNHDDIREPRPDASITTSASTSSSSAISTCHRGRPGKALRCRPW
jgi:hypothetical protein